MGVDGDSSGGINVDGSGQCVGSEDIGRQIGNDGGVSGAGAYRQGVEGGSKAVIIHSLGVEGKFIGARIDVRLDA